MKKKIMFLGDYLEFKYSFLTEEDRQSIPQIFINRNDQACKIHNICIWEARLRNNPYLGYEFDREFMFNFLEVEELLFDFHDPTAIMMTYKPVKNKTGDSVAERN